MQVSPEIREIEAMATHAKIPMLDVLRRANVARTTWWRWSEGHFDPRYSTLRKVREALNQEIAERGQAA